MEPLGAYAGTTGLKGSWVVLVQDGRILNSAILDFQGRSEERPLPSPAESVEIPHRLTAPRPPDSSPNRVSCT